jgi:hypothetical protein
MAATPSNESHPIFTLSFWKATIERVLFTFLECYFGIFLFSAIDFNVFTWNWYLTLGPALGAAILSLVKCLLASLGGNAGPSVANETLTDYPRVARTS